jgi:hypothetical protein
MSAHIVLLHWNQAPSQSQPPDIGLEYMSTRSPYSRTSRRILPSQLWRLSPLEARGCRSRPGWVAADSLAA